MSQPLTDAINSLTLYANSVTGQSDSDLSSAVATLASGYYDTSTTKLTLPTGVATSSNGEFRVTVESGNIFTIEHLTTENNRLWISISNISLSDGRVVGSQSNVFSNNEFLPTPYSFELDDILLCSATRLSYTNSTPTLAVWAENKTGQKLFNSDILASFSNTTKTASYCNRAGDLYGLGLYINNANRIWSAQFHFEMFVYPHGIRKQIFE